MRTQMDFYSGHPNPPVFSNGPQVWRNAACRLHCSSCLLCLGRVLCVCVRYFGISKASRTHTFQKMMCRNFCHTIMALLLLQCKPMCQFPILLAFCQIFPKIPFTWRAMTDNQPKSPINQCVLVRYTHLELFDQPDRGLTLVITITYRRQAGTSLHKDFQL